MKVSFNEIEITLRKAALGAGIPLGLAEDFGRICFWLAIRRCSPLSVGLSALDTFDTENSASGDIVEKVPEWKLATKSGQKLSALYVGSSACDLLCVQQSAIRLSQVDVPLLVLVSAALTSDEHSLGIKVELFSADNTKSVVYCESGMVCAEPKVLKQFVSASAFDMRLLKIDSTQSQNLPVLFPAMPPDEVFAEGATVDESEWSRVEQYAKRMLVPPSERSRSGAGAGEIDCD